MLRNVTKKLWKNLLKIQNFGFILFFLCQNFFNLFFPILSIRVNPDQTWITWPLYVQHSNMEKVEWPTDANVQLAWFYLKERITISAYSRLYFSNAIRRGRPGSPVRGRPCSSLWDYSFKDGLECIDLDECAMSPCNDGFRCDNTHGSFTCVDVNECKKVFREYLGWISRNFKTFIFKPILLFLSKNHKNDN